MAGDAPLLDQLVSSLRQGPTGVEVDLAALAPVRSWIAGLDAPNERSAAAAALVRFAWTVKKDLGSSSAADVYLELAGRLTAPSLNG